MPNSGTPSRTATTAWRRIAAAVREEGRKHDLPCHLCRGARGPIDYRTQAEADRDARAEGKYWLVRAPRPLAFAADHVIAHAAGGQDSIDNAKPSHRFCNEQAGAKQATPRTRTRQAQAVVGYWFRNDGQGQPLPGRAIHGSRTATHTFRGGG
ncbi:HNH endonuclease [Leucobacter chromiiresistens]|uniref:HNH endonuclease n=1 Tax=Leucobacter chromiiresistens TaxID=1079994 RepID=UPI00115FCE2E